MQRSSTGLFVAAAAATALLAAPAGALAKGGTIIAGPIKAKGYQLSLTATDGVNESLSVTAIKRAGGSQQMHSWTFKRVKVSVNGRKATIKGSLGRYGKIDAKVLGAKPATCNGGGRKGKLAGTTKLVLDSTFFKTIKPKTMRALLLVGGPGCVTGGGGGATDGHGLMLTSSAESDAGTLSVSVTKTGSKVTQSVMRTDAPAGTAPASVFHMITATTGEDGLHAAPDLQNASAPAAGPFLTGQLAFAGTPMGTMATGAISGDFAAKFDSIGEQWLPEGTDAILMQH